MATGPLHLLTLDYRVTPQQMGNVHVYPLTPDFAGLWDHLARRWDRTEGFKTPHNSLRVALSTVTGRMVIFTIRRDEHPGDPLSRRSLIVSDGPLDPDLTKICFDAWQTRSYGNPGDGDRLSSFIDFSHAEVRPLIDILERDEAGYITGPWWWKNAIGWSTVQRLAPHAVEDKTRPNRKTEFMISIGSNDTARLVAWDYPWNRTTNEGRSNEKTGYAMAYVSVRGETRRGCPDPIVRIDCHVTRVANFWTNVKTVHVKHPQFPTLLRVPVNSYPLKNEHGESVKNDKGYQVWKTVFRGHTAEIVEACDLAPLALPADAKADLDTVRAVFRSKGKHEIGKGPGAYFTLRMATHITRILGTDPFIYDATSYNIPGKSITTGPIPTDQLPAGLAAAGWKSLRLVVLYADDSTPRRILSALAADYGVILPAGLTEPGAVYDGAFVEIAPGISTVLCKAPDVIMHGRHDRVPLIRSLPSLQTSGADELIAAICETNWSIGARIIDDGKHPTRKDLAGQGIVSQFIVADRTKGDDDYPAPAAVRDLLRSCGVTDDRLAYATCLTPSVAKAAPLTQPVTLIGIHFRRHTYKRVRGQASKPSKLVALLTAIHLDADPTTPPRIELYANGQWLRHAEGLAAFHAGDIGNEHWGRDNGGAHAVREYIENALDGLILRNESNRVVIILDKEEAQSIYAGIGDNPFVTAPLPGRRIAEDGVDVAVARIALGAHAPRPATAYREGEDLDVKEPSYHKRLLFVNDHGHESSWLLTQDSLQHQGAKSPQRIGSKRSREDFGEIAASFMGKDMHATSRVEITIPSPGSWEPGDLAVLIGRLCDQAVAWDHRTSRPAPLHLAHTADRDHPDFKNHDGGGEADEDDIDDGSDDA